MIFMVLFPALLFSPSRLVLIYEEGEGGEGGEGEEGEGEGEEGEGKNGHFITPSLIHNFTHIMLLL